MTDSPLARRAAASPIRFRQVWLGGASPIRYRDVWLAEVAAGLCSRSRGRVR